MIRHIVFFSLKNPAELGLVEAALKRLGEIPESLHFEIGRNLKRDSFSTEVDLVVYAEFADEAALARYKAHPLYAETITIVRPRRELRLAADIKTSTH